MQDPVPEIVDLDRELVRKAQGGDSGAIEALVQRHRNLVSRICCALPGMWKTLRMPDKIRLLKRSVGCTVSTARQSLPLGFAGLLSMSP